MVVWPLSSRVHITWVPRALLVWTTRPPRGSQRPTPPRPRSVSLLVAGPCPALHQSPRQCATSAWQVDACPFVTFWVSKVHRHRVLVPFLQLFDHGLEVLQLPLHALVRIEGVPLTLVRTTVA